MDDITTHTINVSLPSLANLTELQKEFDALELPPAARDALLRTVVIDPPEAVCDPPEAVCDPPEAVCDPPEAAASPSVERESLPVVCDPPGWNGVEPIESVESVPPPVELVSPPVESHGKEIPSRKNGVCCCQ